MEKICRITCSFVTLNGQWQEAEIRPYGQLEFSAVYMLYIMAKGIRSIKAYWKEDGSASMFQPFDNFARLNKSAERLMMPQIQRNYSWRLKEEDRFRLVLMQRTRVYIRPFLFASSEFIAARQRMITPRIITSPVGPYYNGTVAKLSKNSPELLVVELDLQRQLETMVGHFILPQRLLSKGTTKLFGLTIKSIST